MRNKNSSEHRRKVNFGGIDYQNTMTKVRNFVEITPNLPFSEFIFYELYRATFENSELGRMKKILPLHEMAESFGLVSKSVDPKRGRKSYFIAEERNMYSWRRHNKKPQNAGELKSERVELFEQLLKLGE